MSNCINDCAVMAGTSDILREEFILQHEHLILNAASRASYRHITKSDDEWSVALRAFSEAIDKYAHVKGDFIPFSQMLMKRALIDYHRSEASHLKEISTSPFVLEGLDDAEEAGHMDRAAYLAVVEQSQETDNGLQDEILSANEMLKQYGFRFFDLTECSPQQEKTRQECAKAVRYILTEPQLLQDLERRRKLPIRAIASGSGVSRKVLDRYRKYIIMAVLVLHGDYPQLSEYLHFMRKEGNT